MIRWRLLQALGLLGLVLTPIAFFGGLALLFFAHHGLSSALLLAEGQLQQALTLLAEALQLAQPLQEMNEQGALLSQSSVLMAGEALASLGVLDMLGLEGQLGQWQALADGAHRLEGSGFFAQAADFRAQAEGWLGFVQAARRWLVPALVGAGALLGLLSAWWGAGQWALVRLAQAHLRSQNC